MRDVRQILCLSADPWRTIPTRTQQLMTRMRDAQVLLFEPPGKYSRQPGRRVRPGLTVCALPPVLEAEERHRLLFRLHYRKLGKFIRRQMEHHRFKEPLLWCTAPGCGLRLRPGLARPVPPVGERSGPGRRCGLCRLPGAH